MTDLPPRSLADSTQKARVAFLGLGTMGAPMAGHLLRARGELVVWNRTPSRSAPLAEAGARVAASAEEAARLSAVICVCVNRTEDVREVLDAIRPALKPGALVIDHSTISPSATEEHHAFLAAQGVRHVDAPVTGGSMGAVNGTLTVFLGGDEAAVAEASEIIAPYARVAERVGGPGKGQLAKLANQIAVGAALLGLCESLAFAERQGLDLAQIHRLVGGGAGGSWAFANYGPKLLAGDMSPGFSVKNQRKDFAYCLEAAVQTDSPLPGVALVDRLLRELEAAGRGEEATFALFDILRRSTRELAYGEAQPVP